MRWPQGVLEEVKWQTHTNTMVCDGFSLPARVLPRYLTDTVERLGARRWISVTYQGAMLSPACLFTREPFFDVE